MLSSQIFRISLNNLKSKRSGYFMETLKLLADMYTGYCEVPSLQVALTKVAFVNTLRNVYEDIYFSYVYKSTHEYNFATVPSGYYQNMGEFVEALNSAMPNEAQEYIKFQLSKLTGMVTILCFKGATVELSKELQSLLKIHKDVIESKITSESYPDLNQNIRCLKLRSSIVYSTLTNDDNCEKLLTVIPISRGFGELVTYEPKVLQFCDVANDELHLLDIELVDMKNNPAEINSISTINFCFRNGDCRKFD